MPCAPRAIAPPDSITSRFIRSVSFQLRRRGPGSGLVVRVVFWSPPSAPEASSAVAPYDVPGRPGGEAFVSPARNASVSAGASGLPSSPSSTHPSGTGSPSRSSHRVSSSSFRYPVCHPRLAHARLASTEHASTATKNCVAVKFSTPAAGLCASANEPQTRLVAVSPRLSDEMSRVR